MSYLANMERLIPATVLRKMVSDMVFREVGLGQAFCPLVYVTPGGENRILKVDPDTYHVEDYDYAAGADLDFEVEEGDYVDVGTKDKRVGVRIPKKHIELAINSGQNPQTFMRGKIENRLKAFRNAQDYAVLNYYATSGNWGASYKATPGTKWDAANAVPVTDLLTVRRTMTVKPTIAIFSEGAYDALLESAQFLDYFKYTEAPDYVEGIDKIKRLLNLEMVGVEGWGGYTSKVLPVPGGTVSGAMTEEVIFAHVDPGVRDNPMFADDVTAPVFAVQPTSHLNGPEVDEDPWYEAKNKSWHCSVMNSYKRYTINEKLGYCLYNILT